MHHYDNDHPLISNIMQPFLFGLPTSIEESGLISSQHAYNLVGENTGNLAFCFAINRLLGGGLPVASWHAKPEVIDATGDVGVLTLANQLGQHADLGSLAKNFNKLSCKLVGIGLGAQAGNLNQDVTIPEGTLEWVKAIQDRSCSDKPNIGLRGPFTKLALEKYGLADKTVVLGCPTLFINPEKNLGSRIQNRIKAEPQRIAVAGGHQRWKHLAKIEASLVNMCNATDGAYICQSPLEMVRMGRGEIAELTREVRDACRTYISPHLSDLEFIRWADSRALSFFSAAGWIEYLRRFDFVIGTRIHGVMLALQAGVPGLCIAHDSRTTELCETMKVPYVLASSVSGGITRDDLPKLFQFDPVAFDQNRKELAGKYVEFFHNNDLVPAQYLQDLAEMI